MVKGIERYDKEAKKFMKHAKALLIKFIMITVVLWLVLTLGFDVSFRNTLLVSVVLTAVAYLLGDLMVFRKSGEPHEHKKRNMIATASDMVLAFAIIWLMGDALFSNDVNLLSASLISAIIIAGGEWVFHKYMDSQIFAIKESDDQVSNHPNYNS